MNAVIQQGCIKMKSDTKGIYNFTNKKNNIQINKSVISNKFQ